MFGVLEEEFEEGEFVVGEFDGFVVEGGGVGE